MTLRDAALLRAVAVLLALAAAASAAEAQPWTRLHRNIDWLEVAARKILEQEDADASYYVGPIRKLIGTVDGRPYEGYWEWTTEQFEPEVCFIGRTPRARATKRCAMVWSSHGLKRLRFDWRGGGRSYFQVFSK